MNNREAQQLFLVAKYYYHCAISVPKKDVNINKTSAELEKKKIQLNKQGKLDNENKIFAHLTSSAIRLATLREKFEELDLGKDYKIEFRKNINASSADIRKVSNKILYNISDYIHVLLRDAVAHYENEETIERKARGDIIRKVTLSTAVSALHDLLKKCEQQLKSKNLV